MSETKPTKPEEQQNLHKKPSKEELEAGIKAATEALEKEEKPEGDTPPKEEEEKKEEKSSETPGIPVKEEEKKEDQEDVDYKRKFAESTREGIILNSQVKKLSSVIKEVHAVPDPTDEDMIKEYGEDWDLMSETEKKLAKKSLKNDRALSMLGQVAKEAEDIEAWNKKVDEYIGDPKVLAATPVLEGKEDAFKVFASKPSRRGVDFETLTQAFLFEVEKQRPKNKGKMFESGTGGAKDSAPKSDKLSPLEARSLMQTDYKKYVSLLKAGKIAFE